MTVRYHPRAAKVLALLGREQPKLMASISRKLEQADERKNFNELDVKKLEGTRDMYRLRVGGYRVEFMLVGDDVFVRYIDKRGQLYK